MGVARWPVPGDSGGGGVVKHEEGGGLGEKPETEPPWLGFRRTMWNGGGGWCMGVAQWPVPGDGSGGGVMGLRNTRREGVWVKSPGALREMAAADGAWGWHGGPYQAAAAVRLRNTRRGRGLGENPETKPLWLGFGRAVWNGSGGWCVGVAWWHVRGGSGSGVVWSQNTRRGGGLGEKTRNRAIVARFWAATGLQKVEGGAVGLQTPPPVLTYGWAWGVRWYGMGG
jgi:hypothetical protein